ncbi:MAG TPA: ABC transporter permease [Thermoleophilaceae bacterium]|nr:ABC transporter permease [Thermoleophilaceae bacterium]
MHADLTAAERLPDAHRVTGPSAIAGDWRRFAFLTVTLALTDWKLRFYGSVLGYLWSLLRPLLLFGILYVVFSQVVRIGGEVEHYPVQLLLGVVLFVYFAEVTGDCVESVVDREQLVRKVAFPRMVVPLSVALSCSFNLMVNLIAVALFVLLSGVEVMWTWLLVVVPLALLVVLATGVGMLLSALYVPFRDVRPIWDVVSQGLFYATPVFYPVELVLDVSQEATRVVLANPLAAIIVEARHLVTGSSPSAAEAMGGAAWLALPATILIGCTLLGFWVFNRIAPRVAEDL